MKFFDAMRQMWRRPAMKAAVIIVVALIAIVPIVTLVLRGPSTRASDPVAQSLPISAAPQNNRGLYSGAITDAAGKLDVARTIAQVVAVHADTYYYLIWDRHPRTTQTPSVPTASISQDLWAKLPIFASQAATHGIRVVVYLVPPSETVAADYLPYGWNYSAWFKAVGDVAAKHHAIEGIAMDDLGGNFTLTPTSGSHKFTGEQLLDMRKSAREAAPWIKFYALVYGQDVIGATRMLPYFRNAVDGIIYAFAGPNQIRHAPQNTTDANGLFDTTEKIRNVTGCGGAPSCWQATFDKPSQISAPVKLTAQMNLGASTTSRQLRVVYADDRSGADQSSYQVQLSLDGKSLPILGKVVGASGASTLTTSIPPTSSAAVGKFSLEITKSPASRSFSVFIDSIEMKSGATGDNLVSAKVPWDMHAAPGSSWLEVKPLQLVDMYYCTRFGIEGTVAGAADASYVAKLIPQLRRLQKATSSTVWWLIAST